MRSCAKKLILFIYGNVWHGLGDLSMGFSFGVGQTDFTYGLRAEARR